LRSISVIVGYRRVIKGKQPRVAGIANIIMRFDLIDLRLFLHVAEAHSITHGARRANLALASASERVRGMEKTLGVSLLVRDRRGVALSPAGQCLLEHARLVIQQVERMRGELASYARGLSGTVRLLSNTAAISEHLPHALASFLADHPTISVDVEERESADIAERVASGMADVGIATEAALSDAITAFPFKSDQLVVVMRRGDDLGRSRQVRLIDIVKREFVATARDGALQRHLAGHAARLGVIMKVRARVHDFDAVCRMVEMGVGIAIIPEASAKRSQRIMKIDAIRLRDPWASRRLAICVRDFRSLPVGAQQLVEHLRSLATI
jgi:DNA-binding transcriptional LysR family regulator